MSQYMLLFSLGPVQTFIAQARKTRDLWLGSLLLSKLMEAAMAGINDEAFVFPSQRKVHDTPDIPNKYIALFADLDQAQKAATQSEAQIQECWEAVCKAVWDKVIEGYDTPKTRALWERQTNFATLFEIYWVIVENTAESYGGWLEETESMFAARKQLRNFKAQEEPGEKSAISGEREILHGESTDRKDVQEFWKKVASKRSALDIDKEGNEHLDAIDLVKRFAMEAKGIIPEKPFPSTSSIATASFVEGLLTKTIGSNALQNWRGLTRYSELADMRPEAIPYLNRKADSAHKWLLTLDGDCYFPETFTEYRLKKDYYITDAQSTKRRNIVTEGSTGLSALFRSSDDQGITRPRPYYATIQMDGDNMGILLSGVADKNEHEKISAALSDFSRNIAPPLLQDKQYPGRLVYAGGDDVLAFAPLARDVPEKSQPKHILDLVDMLQNKYRERVKAALPPPQDEKQVQGVTASTGIVIAHHYTSLSYVLRSAREAERMAKKRYGKNALVVTLMRRSGEQTQVGCHWRYSKLGADDSPGQPIALFSRFYQLFKDDVLSPKCIYTLLEEAPALVKMSIEEAQDSKKSSSAMQSEIKRVLKRQRDNQRVADFPDTEVNQYAWHLTRLAVALDADEYPHLKEGESLSVELHADRRRYGLVEVLGWLLVMAFLARREKE